MHLLPGEQFEDLKNPAAHICIQTVRQGLLMSKKRSMPYVLHDEHV